MQPTPAENDSGLVYTAKATLAGSTYPGDTVSLGPTSLFVNLTVSNPTSAQRDVWLAGCAAWERIYVTANLSGTPLMDRARSTVCQPTYQHVVLGPGASQEIGISGAGVGAGSDTLSTGRY
ncbi:MAG TPA: hypothetical protein VHB25_13990, partial [Gemmatimonadaceae bacterium]|nr:hypothetical protein [Gemmatimonadaceae bacterium]